VITYEIRRTGRERMQTKQGRAKIRCRKRKNPWTQLPGRIFRFVRSWEKADLVLGGKIRCKVERRKRERTHSIIKKGRTHRRGRKNRTKKNVVTGLRGQITTGWQVLYLYLRGRKITKVEKAGEISLGRQMREWDKKRGFQRGGGGWCRRFLALRKRFLK